MSESNYILGHVIARGGMAEVYRGLHVGQDGFRRLVAVKRVLPQFSSNSEFAQMFRDEAHIGQRLQHANVVKVECYSVIDNCPSIVMEFVDGSDVRSFLADVERSKEVRRIPIPMVLYIIAEAARGLHYTHTRRDDVTSRPLELVHRDISPQNILVSYNGEVKITDFGIASADGDFKNTETKAGIVKGKYSYMSPEQISAKKVDARTDIFALSIVLWEMLSMRRLFSAENEIEVIEMVKSCRIPNQLSDFNKDVSPQLEAIVKRGLAKDPNRRYGTMDEMERTLRGLLSKEYPNFTVGDLGNFVKQVLSVKHDASQLEIKKMLTTTNLKSTGKSNKSIELELGKSDIESRKDLTVSRLPSPVPILSNKDLRDYAKKHEYQQSSMSPKRFRNAPSTRFGQSSTSFLNIHYIALAIVIALIVTVIFRVQTNAARDLLSATLRTIPAIVRVKVNGHPSNSGRYSAAPHRLKLEQGVNIIEVARPGYQPETLTIDTRQGEQKSVPIVRLNSRGSFVLTRFVLVGTDPVQINLNDGFSVGNLSPRKPLFEVKDLVEGVPADIEVSERGKVAYRCKFTPFRYTDQRPLIVSIDSARNRCDVSPPKIRSEN